MKMLGDSWIYSRLVILTSIPSVPEIQLNSEKPFFTSGDKTNFVF
jgi:hypothetical protein